MFVNFYAIHYGDKVEQSMCTFSQIRANDFGKLHSTEHMGRR